MFTILLFEVLIAGWILLRQERRHTLEERFYLKQLGMPDPSPQPTLPVLESMLSVTIEAALFIGGGWLLWAFFPHLEKFLTMPHGIVSVIFPVLLTAAGFTLLFLGTKSLLAHRKTIGHDFSPPIE